MKFIYLKSGSIALFIVIFLAGCGADANNGHQLITDSLSATDSSELFPEQEKAPKEKEVAALAPASPQLVLPTGSILDNLSKADSLKKFSAIVKKSDLVKKLHGTGPYTIFAPSDVAFATLDAAALQALLQPKNRAQLQQLVGTHLIAGKLTIADLEDGATLLTTGGQQLKVTKKKGQVRINNALVANPDGACLNGVVHVVDQVLDPAVEVK